MYVTRQQDVDPEEEGDAPLFYGGRVTRQPLVGKTENEEYNCGIVYCYEGSKNHFHAHRSEQMLYERKGVGIVANESEEVQMETGDTAFSPAGEKHWHGAADGTDFFHISLTRPDSQTDMVK